MKFFSSYVFIWFLLCSVLMGAEATDLREWKAASGHSLKAKALKVVKGKILFEREGGKTVTVPMDKLVAEDQEFLKQHFELKDLEEAGTEAPAEGVAADDLPHPLGATTAELSCGKYHYFLYLPKSLRKGVKHPVLFIMSPNGGKPGVAKRYIDGAERNRWILAVSKESKNKFAHSGAAIEAMMDEVQKSLPVDKKRMYVTGFSGGSRMAYWASQKETSLAGIIACGAGGDVGGRKQVVYGLCGSNCFNRTDMAHAFKEVKSKGSVLRYFEGKHVWAKSEMCEDAITHLNGVFLEQNQDDYEEDYQHYVYQVGKLITENKGSNPQRAYMWADFLERHDIDSPEADKARKELGADEKNVQFVKGLYDVRDFAEKTFGDVSASQWKIDPKVAAAFKREAAKYAGSYWEGVLMKMSENAQKF